MIVHGTLLICEDVVELVLAREQREGELLFTFLSYDPSHRLKSKILRLAYTDDAAYLDGIRGSYPAPVVVQLPPRAGGEDDA